MEIDNLELLITAESDEAVSALDELIGKLGELDGKLFGGKKSTNVSNVSDEVKKTNKAVSNEVNQFEKTAKMYADVVANMFNFKGNAGKNELIKNFGKLNEALNSGIDTTSSEKAIESTIRKYRQVGDVLTSAKTRYDEMRDAAKSTALSIGSGWTQEFPDKEWKNIQKSFKVGGFGYTEDVWAQELNKSGFNIDPTLNAVDALKQAFEQLNEEKKSLKSAGDNDFIGTGDLENAKNVIDEIKKELASISDRGNIFSESNKGAVNLNDKIKEIQGKAYDIGFGKDIPNDIAIVNKTISQLEDKLDSLNQKMARENAIGAKRDSKSYLNLVYDIAKVEGELDKLHEKAGQASTEMSDIRFHGIGFDEPESVGEAAFENIEADIEHIGEVAEEVGHTISDQLLNMLAKPVDEVVSRLREVNEEIYNSTKGGASTVELGPALTERDNLVKVLESKAPELLKDIVPPEAQAQIDAFYERIKDIGKGVEIPDTFDGIVAEMERIDKQLDKLFEKEENLRLGEGLDETSSKFRALAVQIVRLRNEYLELSRAKTQAMASGGTPELVEMSEEVTPGNMMEEEYPNAMAKFLASVGEGFGNIGQMAGAAGAKIKEVFANIGISIVNGIQHPIETVKALFSGLKTALGAVGQVASTAVHGIISFGKGAANAYKSMMNFPKAIGKFLGALTGIDKAIPKVQEKWKNLRKSLSRIPHTLGMMVIRKALYAVLKAIGEGVQDLAKYSAQIDSAFDKNLSQTISGLRQFGYQLVAAFEPIYNFIAPALNYLISLLNTVAAAMTQFFNGLTGNTTWTKAVGSAASYGASLDDSMGGASKNAKDLKQQLQGFDKLNVITSDKNKGGGGGGGGGGLNPTYETNTIDPKILDFVKQLQDVWKSGDLQAIESFFENIGNAIGITLKNALENIPWSDIQESAKKVAVALGGLINGFIETEGLGTTIGTTIAEGLNTAFTFVDTWLTTVHWDSLGKFLGDIVNGAVETLDWELVGKTFADGWNALFETVASFLDTVKWDELGAGIMDGILSFFDNIDYEAIGSIITGIPKAILDFLTGAIEEIDWSAVPSTIIEKIGEFFSGTDFEGLAESIGSFLSAAITAGAELVGSVWDLIKGYFEDEIDACGGNVVEGFLKGITDAIANIANWIKTNIIDPFIEGFKKHFGIHSPSTKMASLGKQIIAGLKQGAKEKWDAIKTWFKELPTKILKFWDDIKNSFLDIGNKVISGLKEGISEKWSEFKEWFITKRDHFIDVYKNIKDSFAEKGDLIVSGIKKGISDAWSNFKSWFERKRDGLANLFSESKFTDFGKNIVNGISSGIDSVWSTITGWADKIAEKFNVNVNVNASQTNGTKKAKGGAYYGGSWHQIDQYAKGGLPSHGSMFVAGESGPELVGQVGNRTEVLNGSQIAAMVSNGVVSGVTGAISSQNAYLQKQINLLTELVAKDMGIKSQDIFAATQREASNYTMRTGRPAFN